MSDPPSFICPSCGKVSVEAAPVCECGHSYYPRAKVGLQALYYTPLTEEQRLSGRATTGLILGVLSVVGFFSGPYAFVAGGFGLMISISGMKSVKRKRAAIALICNIVGIVLSTVSMIFMFTGRWFM